MSRRILVVDDSKVLREQLKRTLVAAGFDVEEAADGIEALQKAITEPIALVFCDLNMPRMNGIDFLRFLAKSERAKTLPVVMLTTEAQSELMQQSQTLGAKGWIVKPFKPELLIGAARRLVVPREDRGARKCA